MLGAPGLVGGTVITNELPSSLLPTDPATAMRRAVAREKPLPVADPSGWDKLRMKCWEQAEQAVEDACEMECGVLIKHGLPCHAEARQDIPFGQIWIQAEGP